MLIGRLSLLMIISINPQYVIMKLSLVLNYISINDYTVGSDVFTVGNNRKELFF